MRGTIAGVLDRFRGSETVRLSIVWQGKVKPVVYRLLEVLGDGLVLIPDEGGTESSIHPFTAIHSIQVTIKHPA